MVGSLRVCDALLDINVIDDPKSDSALVMIFLPPGPFSMTWLVIIRMSGKADDLEMESVLVVAAVSAG